MKFILSILLISIFTWDAPPKANIDIKLEIVGITGMDNCIKDSFNYTARLSVINNSEVTFSFWTMNCSWFVNWLSQSEDVSLCPWDCDKNYPLEIKLEPGKEIIFYATVNRKPTTNRTKFGFVALNFEDTKKLLSMYDSQREILKTREIYWSNEVAIEFKSNSYRIID